MYNVEHFKWKLERKLYIVLGAECEVWSGDLKTYSIHNWVHMFVKQLM